MDEPRADTSFVKLIHSFAHHRNTIAVRKLDLETKLVTDIDLARGRRQTTADADLLDIHGARMAMRPYQYCRHVDRESVVFSPCFRHPGEGKEVASVIRGSLIF